MNELRATYELTTALRDYIESTTRDLRTLAREIERLTEEQETMVGDIAVLKHEMSLS